MAQLVISAAGAAVGFYVGGPQGAQIGWAVGSMIGSSLNPQKVQGSRLQDLSVGSSQYGKPIPRGFGSPRVPGQIWWASEKREISTTTSEGKGGGPEVTSYSYEVDLLIGLFEGPIKGVSRIWSNGKLIFNASPSASLEVRAASYGTNAWTGIAFYFGLDAQMADPIYEAAIGQSSAIAYRGRAICVINALQLGANGQLPNLTFELGPSCADFDTPGGSDAIAIPPLVTGQIVEEINGQDHNTDGLEEFATTGASMVGMTVTVQTNSFTETIAWGQFGAIDSTWGRAAGTGWTLTNFGDTFTSEWVLTSSVDILSIIINGAPGRVVFDVVFTPENTPGSALGKGFALSYADSINPLLGFYVQYSNRVSVQNVFYTNPKQDLYAAMAIRFNPNFRGEFVFLADTDNATTAVSPAGGECSTEPKTATLPEVISSLCNRAGLQASQIDVTDLQTSPVQYVHALTITQVPATRATLDQLAAAYFFETTLRDKLYFRPRAASPVADIPFTDLAAGADAPAAEPLALTVASDLELPPQVAVSYANLLDDHQQGAEYSDRIISGQAATQTIELAMGLTPAEAKGIADAIVVDTYASRTSTTIALPLTYARLEAGDVVTVRDEDNAAYRLRLVRKREENAVLQFEAVLDDQSALTSLQITDETQAPSGTVTTPGGTVFEPLDIPILRDADDGPGYYVAAKGSTTTWPGAQIQSSINDTDFTTVAEVNESAVFGTASTTLATYTGIGFDERNAITVNVGNGELSSSTRAAMLADETINAMLIGSEAIRFRDATLSSPGVYVLTGLLRGQRGTEWAIATHGASELVVLLRPQGLRRVTGQDGDIGSPRYVRGVTLGTVASDAVSEAFTNTGIGAKPFAPVDLRASKDPWTGDITLTWKRRTRSSTRLVGLGGISAPLGEASESYRVRIYSDSGYTVLKRTITATKNAASYTTAQQIADLGSASAAFYVRVAQLSQRVGAGYELSAAVSVSASVGGATALSPVLFAGSADGWLAATTAYADSGLSGVINDLRATSFWKSAARDGPFELERTVTTPTSSPTTAPEFVPAYGRIAQTSARVVSFEIATPPKFVRSALDLSSDPGVITPSIAFAAPRIIAGEAARFMLFGESSNVYSSADGVTWASLGAMSGAVFPHTIGDGTYLTHGISKPGARWFVVFGLGGGLGANANRLFYTDDADAVTGWTACTGISVGANEALHKEVVYDGAVHYAAVTAFAAGTSTVYVSSDNGETWASEYTTATSTGFETFTSGTNAPFAVHLQVTGTTAAVDKVRLYAINGVVFEKFVGSTTWAAKASGLVNPQMGFNYNGQSSFLDSPAVFTGGGTQVRYEIDGVAQIVSGF